MMNEIDRVRQENEVLRQQIEEMKIDGNDLKQKNDLLERRNKESREEFMKVVSDGGKLKEGEVFGLGVMIVNIERWREVDEKAKGWAKEKDKSERLLRDLREKENAIKEMGARLDEMADKVEEKNMEVRKLKEEIEIRLVHESKDLKKANKFKVQAENLKIEIANRDKFIKQLQQQIELLESKLIKLTKTTDRLRFENQRVGAGNAISSRLAQLYNTRAAPAGAASYRTSQLLPGQASIPRDFSPEPLQYPPAKPAGESTDPEFFTSRSQAGARSLSQPNNPAAPPQNERSDNPFAGANTSTYGHQPSEMTVTHQPLLSTYLFIKANSEDHISPYLVRQDNKVMLAGEVRGVNKYERTPTGDVANRRPFGFKKTFTQHELEELSREFSHVYDQDEVLLLVYGSPLNIKLFLILKAVLAFFAKLQTTNGSYDLEIVLQTKFATTIQQKLKDPSRKDSVTLQPIDSYGELQLVRISSSIPNMVESAKKVFYEILSDTSAATFKVCTLTSVPVQGSGAIKRTLTIVRSQVQRMLGPHNFSELIQEFMGHSSSAPTMQYLNSLSFDHYLKVFFLVLEPGKVSTYEESQDLLELHNSVERFRIQPRVYDQDRGWMGQTGSVNRGQRRSTTSGPRGSVIDGEA
jgi:hypothetical protein